MKHSRAGRRRTTAAAAAVLVFVLALVFGALSLRETAPDFAGDGLLRVCIDAGHGGDDPGATDPDGVRLEKDDCLAAALAVQAALAEAYPQIEVLLTRSDDTFLELAERCALANDFRADLFLSIHRNSAEGSAHGVEVWIPADKPATDKRLAQDVLDGLRGVGISDDRGVKSGTAGNASGNYYVLGNTDMPGCLIELGFMTSAEDNALLDAHLGDYARAIADPVAGLRLAD